MEEELVNIIEADLRAIVEEEVNKFNQRYSECIEVNGIWFNEDFSTAIYDKLLHGLPCDIFNNVIVTREHIYEFQDLKCRVVYEDKEYDFRRTLALMVLLQLPFFNRCYIKTEIYYYDIGEVAEHIVRTAEAEPL
jgi:hypothetical protein